MYWRAIGVSVATIFRHTYSVNQPYARPIVPFGQVYGGVSAAEIRAFRFAAAARGATGVHWWDWQEARPFAWRALGSELPRRARRVPRDPWPVLGRGARGDLVVWAQEHLAGAGWAVPVDGRYGAATARVVRSFRRLAALPASSRIDADAWAALLGFPVRTPAWSAARRPRAARAGTGPAAPWSARLPGRRGDTAPRVGP